MNAAAAFHDCRHEPAQCNAHGAEPAERHLARRRQERVRVELTVAAQ